MGVSGNSIAGKGYQSFTVSEDLLQKVTEAVQAGEKKARSSGDIQMFEVFCRGFRQNIALGRVYVIPASICSDRKNFPTALLYGCLVRVFGTGGEELGDLIDKKIGESEFDEYSQADFDAIKEKLFGAGDGKYKSIVLYAPAWWNKREYFGFLFTEDEAQLKNNLRHQVFAAYYDPRFSSAFNAIMTNVNTTHVDVTDITPKLNFPFLAENILKQYPDLQKRAGGRKKKILLNRKTADAVTKEVLDPQELDVFDSLDQALSQALLPGVDDAEKAGEEHHGEAEGEKVPRVAACNHQPHDEDTMQTTCERCGAELNYDAKNDKWVAEKKASAKKGDVPRNVTDKDIERGYLIDPKASAKVAHIGADGICPGCKKPGSECECAGCTCKHAAFQKAAYVKHCPGHKNSKGEAAPWCIVDHKSGKIISSHKTKGEAKSHLQDMHAHSGSSADILASVVACEMPAAHEAPFTNVGPGTEAAAEQVGMVKGVKEKLDESEAQKGDLPIGIAIDENGVPRREEEAKASSKKATNGDSDSEEEEKNPLQSAAEGIGNAVSTAVEILPELLASGKKGSHDAFTPEKLKGIHPGNLSDKDAIAAVAEKKWGTVTIPLNFKSGKKAKIAQSAAAEYVAEHLAMSIDERNEVASPKAKKASAEREEKLDRLRIKQAVALDIDDIWAEITEDMGPAPVVDIDVPAGDSSEQGNAENKPNPGRPNKKDIGSLPEAFKSDKPEDDKAMSDSEAQEDSMPEAKHDDGEPESGKPWSVSSSMEDFVKEAYDELEDISLSENAMAAAREAIDSDDEIIYDVAANAGQMVDNVKHMGWFVEEVARAIMEQEEAGLAWEEPDLDEHGEKLEGDAHLSAKKDDECEKAKETVRKVKDVVKKADTADNPANWEGGEGIIQPKTDAEVSDTTGPDAPPPGQKEAALPTPNKPPAGKAGADRKTAELIGMPLPELLEAIDFLDGDGIVVTDLDLIARDIEASVYQINSAQDLADVINNLDGMGLIVENPEMVLRGAAQFYDDYAASQHPKQSNEVQPDAAEAKAETVSPDAVDKDIDQPTVSAEEAAKVAAHQHQPHNPDSMQTVCEVCGAEMHYEPGKDVWIAEKKRKNQKEGSAISGDAAEAKAETESPDSVDQDIQQPTVSVEEAAKVADDISGDIAEAKSEAENPDSVDQGINQPTESAEEAAKVGRAHPKELKGEQPHEIEEAEYEVSAKPKPLEDRLREQHEQEMAMAASIGERNDDVPVSQGDIPDEEQPASELGGAQPEAHDVPPQADSKTSALTPMEQEEDAINGICPHCHGEDTEMVRGENDKVLYCHDCERVTWTFGMGKAAAAGDGLPEEIPFDFGAGDLADIVLAEDEDTETKE